MIDREYCHDVYEAISQPACSGIARLAATGKLVASLWSHVLFVYLPVGMIRIKNYFYYVSY